MSFGPDDRLVTLGTLFQHTNGKLYGEYVLGRQVQARCLL